VIHLARASAALLALAIAPLAAAAPASPDISAYGRLPNVEFTTLSPSGERLALVEKYNPPD